MARVYTHRGFTGSLGQWSRRLGVPPSTLGARIRKFGDTEEGLEMALRSGSQKWMRRAKMITCKGVTLSIKQWAKRVGLTRAALSSRLNSGYTVEEALRKKPKYSQADKGRMQGKRIEMDGIVDSIAGHCRRYGIRKETVRHRRKMEGMSIEDAIRTPLRHGGNMKYVTIGGERLTISEWLKRTGISHSTFRSRVKKGWSVEDALTKCIEKHPKKRRTKRRRSRHPNHVKMKRIGNRRKSIRDWCREFGISESAVRRRIKSGWPFKRAVMTTPLAPAERGRKRDLLGEMCREAGRKRSTVARRLKCGWRLEEALNTKILERRGLDNRRARHVFVNGEEMTMTEACRRLGMSPSSARAREMMGWSTQDAVTIPKIEAKDRPGRAWAARRRREIASLGVII